jgi:hypothetical protein
MLAGAVLDIVALQVAGVVLLPALLLLMRVIAMDDVRRLGHLVNAGNRA